MPFFAIVLIVIAAFTHAGWNILAKRAVAALGSLLVVAGVFVLAGGRTLLRQLRAPTATPAHDRVVAGIVWGSMTGVLIAAYAVNDGYAVKMLSISPILVDWSSNAFRTCVFAPRVLVDRAQMRSELPRYWKSALGVAVLGPLGYILGLQAMTIAPVSHVRRLLAAGLIVVGVMALALG